METPSGAAPGGFVSLPLTSPSEPSEPSSSYPPSSLLTASHPQSGRLATPTPPPTPLESSSQFQYVSEKQQSRILSPHPALLRKPSFLTRGPALASPGNHVASKSPYPFSRMYAVVRGATPTGASARWRREESVYGEDGKLLRKNSEEANYKDDGFWGLLARILRPGNRPSKRLLVLILLNLAYSATEFLIGLFTRRIGEHRFIVCVN